MKIEPKEIYYFSHKGKREYQEDASYISSDKRLFIVCDGVGGLQRGDLASNTVIDYIGVSYENYDGPCVEDVLESFMRSAKKLLDKLVSDNADLEGMATTLAMVYIGDEHITTWHIGDSRIIFIDSYNDKLWASKDHSIVQELLDNKILESEEDSLTHPMKNRVTRVIQGTKQENEKPLKIDSSEIKSIHKDDLILLCTDGVIEDKTSKDIEYIFKNGECTGHSWTELDHYCKNNSNDNATAILIEF